MSLKETDVFFRFIQADTCRKKRGCRVLFIRESIITGFKYKLKIIKLVGKACGIYGGFKYGNSISKVNRNRT